jgi:hypothetical protein
VRSPPSRATCRRCVRLFAGEPGTAPGGARRFDDARGCITAPHEETGGSRGPRRYGFARSVSRLPHVADVVGG